MVLRVNLNLTLHFSAVFPFVHCIHFNLKETPKWKMVWKMLGPTVSWPSPSVNCIAAFQMPSVRRGQVYKVDTHRHCLSQSLGSRHCLIYHCSITPLSCVNFVSLFTHFAMSFILQAFKVIYSWQLFNSFILTASHYHWMPIYQ